MSDKPLCITFLELSYVLIDVHTNSVLGTEYGNLAIFSTFPVAALVAERSGRDVEIRAVRITPVDVPQSDTIAKGSH